MITAGFAIPSASDTTIGAGKACWPTGKVAVSEGKRFTCIKVGAKRIWNSGVNLPTVGPKITSRLTSPTLTMTDGQPANFVDLTATRAIQTWLPNHGANTKVYHLYAETGSTMNLSWHITNTVTGESWPNKRAGLLLNSNIGGYQETTFRYRDGAAWRSVKANTDGESQTIIPGMADTDGNITFSITNTNSIAQAEPQPYALNKVQPAQNIQLFSYISLVGYSSTLNETRDILIVHYTKPESK